jgi:hypothetical protein
MSNFSFVKKFQAHIGWEAKLGGVDKFEPVSGGGDMNHVLIVVEK